MTTKVLKASNIEASGPTLQDVATALREGALVIFPTETVYGLAASAVNPDGIKRLRALRPDLGQQPLTVHLPNRAAAADYVDESTSLMRRFSRKGWPGPISLICRVIDSTRTTVSRRYSPPALGAVYGAHSVALRVPDHAITQRILTLAEVPVVAASANLPGEVVPVEFGDAMADFLGQVDYAIDAGRSRHGGASTVIEVSDDTWVIRRVGVVDERVVRRMAVSEVLFVCTGNSCRSPMAEFMFRDALIKRMGVSGSELRHRGFSVSSAGSFAPSGGLISKGSLIELDRRGIQGAMHRSQTLSVELIQQAERIFVMSSEHREAVLDLVPSAADRVKLLDESQPIADPVGGDQAGYERCADQIEVAVQRRIEELVNEDLHW